MRFILIFIALISSLSAQEIMKGDLVINNVWTRATPLGAKVAGGFLTITNKGKTSEWLLGGSFPNANRFEVHEMRHNNGMMQMRELTQGLEIKPNETVELKPGSYHLMFMDLTAQITLENPPKGVLKFKNAGEIDVNYKVLPIGRSMMH